MTEPDSVSLQTACIMLGNYSEATVRRMLRDNALTSYGRGRLLRVTIESIEAYKKGERPWQRGAGSAAAAQSSGSGTARSSPVRRGASAVVDFPIDRRPKKR